MSQTIKSEDSRPVGTSVVATALEIPVQPKDLPVALNNAVTMGGVRCDLFNREENGLAESSALVFRGRRILIYPRRYLAWMETRSRKSR